MVPFVLLSAVWSLLLKEGSKWKNSSPFVFLITVWSLLLKEGSKWKNSSPSFTYLAVRLNHKRTILQNPVNVKCQSLSHVWVFVTPGTVARQAPLSMDSPGKNTGVGYHSLGSRGSSWPRDQTQVSCSAGRFFTIWATREA